MSLTKLGLPLAFWTLRGMPCYVHAGNLALRPQSGPASYKHLTPQTNREDDTTAVDESSDVDSGSHTHTT